MKKYDELTARLLERRDRYVAAQAAKRKRLMRVALPAGGGLLVTLLCVGLWQGGAFENTPPVTDGSGQGTTVPAAPTTATGDSAPTDADGTTIEGADTTTAKPTTTTTTETATTTTEPYILVGGEDDFTFGSDNSDGYPSLKRRFISPTLEEKMKEYCDVNAVFQVGVMSAYTIEDDKEISNFLKTNEEFQSFKKQRKAASEAYKEAKKHYEDCEYPDDDPRREDLKRKMNELSNERSDLLEKIVDYYYKIVRNRMEERLSYAAQYSITEPVSGFGINGNGYYMQLTADAINELADRGGYEFYLASDPEEIVFGRDM